MQRFAVLCCLGMLLNSALAGPPPTPVTSTTPKPAGAESAAVRAYAKLPVCRLDPDDATRLAVEPCRTAPQRKQARRAVAQQLLTMPEAPPLVLGSAAPAAAPAPAPLLGAGTSSTRPASPLPIGTCGPGGCWDANGGRHNGAGTVTIDQNGKTCTRNGAWLQCF